MGGHTEKRKLFSLLLFSAVRLEYRPNLQCGDWNEALSFSFLLLLLFSLKMCRHKEEEEEEEEAAFSSSRLPEPQALQ